MKVNAAAAQKISGSPTVQRAVDKARQAARETAARLPRPTEQTVALRASDFAGVRTTALLVDGDEARLARKAARRLGLPRTIDDASAWASFGALAALLRIVDDGRRRSVIVDAVGQRSVFSQWATKIGFAPVHSDVMRPQVVGTDVDAGSVDFVVRLHPHSAVVDTVDEDLAWAGSALRTGGLVSITVRLDAAVAGGMSMADLRSLIARVDEQGLSLVGDLSIDDSRKLRELADTGAGGIGLALLTFRRR
ncbi:hypothetical protein [Rudaeicoccus suwonensis]|uniref:Uncharacterized protein n=1 Tax=Rudaeicoccus suwonensis TaxID=657409 RepID=A0A561E948_9MICO|nr:hypothetical protein [Rudaeicoccus suwonensis]TWE12126.1 hypothetical protein BKA23_0922 [Rudaeicoccus suwonensis]